MKKLYTYKRALVMVTIVSLPLLFASLSGSKYLIKSTGAHPGSTGAPGDQTCAKTGCHANAQINNPGVGVNTLVYPAADSTYIPGQTYNITLQVQKAGIQRFGFELCVLDNTANESAGNLVITDVNRTQEITHTVSGNNRQSITHTFNGTPANPSTGQTSWSFNWVAPSSNVGNITFYYCTNCTNNNNAASGDALYINKFTIKPASGFSIAEFVDENGVRAFYDDQDKQVVLNYSLKQDKQVLVKINDMVGREIATEALQSRSRGANTARISLGNDIASGVYLVKLCIDNRVLTKKVMIR